MTSIYEWRGLFDSAEYSTLHSDAFGSTDSDVDWPSLHAAQSFGWVTAKEDGRLVGFVNVIWDGHAHAWIQDVMVASNARSQGVGTQLVATAREECARAGCEWLHVDFEEALSGFYLEACGFLPSSAGLMWLK